MHLATTDQLRVGVAVDLTAADLARGIELLGDISEVHLALGPSRAEITGHDADAGVWETAVLPAVTPGGLAACVRTADLRAAVEAGEELWVQVDGSVAAAGLWFERAREVDPPPRPTASSVLRERLHLRPAATSTVLRLDGPAIIVPARTARRLSQRRVTSVAVFEQDGWFVSGIRHGEPPLVVTAAVGGY